MTTTDKEVVDVNCGCNGAKKLGSYSTHNSIDRMTEQQFPTDYVINLRVTHRHHLSENLYRHW